MKKPKIGRNRKMVDLVELVRNRYRFQPYPYPSNTNSTGRNNLRALRSNPIDPLSSTGNLVTNQRQPTRRSKRYAARSQRKTRGEQLPSHQSIGMSPCCSTIRTFRDETSQTSIPSELRHLLEDDTEHSDEADNDKNGEKTCEELAELSSDTECIALNIHESNTDELTTSNETIADEQNIDPSRSCSSELRTSIDFLGDPQASSADSVQRDSNQQDSDQRDSDQHDDAQNTEDHRGTEDGEERNGVEDRTDISSDQNRSENETEAETAPVVPEQRSQLWPEIATAADEEAGGDGHHNNSVIEIEITLTSGNDSNTNSEDDENDTDGLVDEESEDN